MINERLNLRSSTLSMLQHIAKTTSCRLALPQVVAEEVLARYDRKLRSALREAENARKFLAELAGTPVVAGTLLDLEQERRHRRRQLTATFEVLPTPEGAADEALRREA